MIKNKLFIFKIIVSTILIFIFLITASSINAESDKLERRNIGTSEALMKRNYKTLEKIQLIKATVLTVDNFTITAINNGKTYTIETDVKTRYLRKFYGQSSFNEIKVNHVLDIYGRFTDSSKSIIQAYLIRNQSIQKKQGVFIGLVSMINSDNWTIETQVSKTIKILPDNSTKFLNRKEDKIQKTDISVSHKIRVKGVLDLTEGTISEISTIKDYDLPQKPTPFKKKF